MRKCLTAGFEAFSQLRLLPLITLSCVSLTENYPIQCICVFAWVYACVYAWVYMHVLVCMMNVSICVNMCMYVHIYVYVCACVCYMVHIHDSVSTCCCSHRWRNTIRALRGFPVSLCCIVLRQDLPISKSSTFQLGRLTKELSGFIFLYPSNVWVSVMYSHTCLHGFCRTQCLVLVGKVILST